MTLLKSEQFIRDVERQYDWYVEQADWDVANRYLAAVEATCVLIDSMPMLGPKVNSLHPNLRAWRYFVALRPFQRHLVFYSILDGAAIMLRTLQGNRDLTSRLLNPRNE